VEEDKEYRGLEAREKHKEKYLNLFEFGYGLVDFFDFFLRSRDIGCVLFDAVGESLERVLERLNDRPDRRKITVGNGT
jgi:hypothetical protein